MIKYYSVREAAKLLHVSKQAIYQRIANGLIKHRIIGGYILIPAYEVGEFEKDDSSEFPNLRRLKRVNSASGVMTEE